MYEGPFGTAKKIIAIIRTAAAIILVLVKICLEFESDLLIKNLQFLNFQSISIFLKKKCMYSMIYHSKYKKKVSKLINLLIH